MAQIPANISKPQQNNASYCFLKEVIIHSIYNMVPLPLSLNFRDVIFHHQNPLTYSLLMHAIFHSRKSQNLTLRMKYVFVHFKHFSCFKTCDWPWCLRWCSVDVCHPQTWWTDWDHRRRSSPQTCCWWSGCIEETDKIISSHQKSLFHGSTILCTLRLSSGNLMIQNWSEVLWTIKEGHSVYNLVRFLCTCNQI